MNDIRYLFIVENPGYSPQHRAQLLRDLRGILPVLNLRIASRHLEIVVRGVDPEEARRKIEETMGRVIAVMDVTNEDSLGGGDIAKFVDLFNAERFWEAHAEVEPIWRKNGDKTVQALILISAAFIKIQEGLPDKFVLLAREALELLKEAPPRLGCIDMARLREELSKSLTSRSPFKITCL